MDASYLGLFGFLALFELTWELELTHWERCRTLQKGSKHRFMFHCFQYQNYYYFITAIHLLLLCYVP